MSQLKSFFNDDYSVESKPALKSWIDKLIDVIDNGTFFREPAVFIYRVIGVLSLLLWVAVYIGLYSDYGFRHMFFQAKTVVNGIVLVLISLAMGVFTMLIWINRSNKLRSRVSEGSDITVIPLAADFFQTSFECYGLVVMTVCPVCAIYFGLIGQLFIDMGDYLLVLLSCLCIAAGAILGGYGIIALGHLIGENLRSLAIIVNNVRDLGDIHRAATMPDETPAPEAPAAEEAVAPQPTESAE